VATPVYLKHAGTDAGTLLLAVDAISAIPLSVPASADAS